MLFPVSPGLELAVVDGTQFGCLGTDALQA